MKLNEVVSREAEYFRYSEQKGIYHTYTRIGKGQKASDLFILSTNRTTKVTTSRTLGNKQRRSNYPCDNFRRRE